MRQILKLLLLFVSIAAHANETAFYRLNIVNDHNQLLVLKIKDRDLWVTPGFYKTPEQFEISQLYDLAADYGLTVSTPKLNGEFDVSMAPDKPFQKRIFYSAMANGKLQRTPDYIESWQWLAWPEALAQIKPSLPHLALLLNQTQQFPEQVWHVRLQRELHDGKPTLTILEDFNSGKQPK
ncbi:hypothetical protein [Planctobacterium marinum]|uniref:Uncharacterized protein n=1 Tax=Planctobacterium marinum TaxID=1631968 RepID=A0AA48KQ86_9ALTE|nr:hypothetical protein MACH26_03380 [Planctobacterium marinum]